MKTSVDTNVFVALLDGDGEQAGRARRTLDVAASRAEMVVSPAVFAELVAGERTPEFVSRFFSEKGVEVHWDLGEGVWREAGLRYAAYAANRRRETGGNEPRRILADFLIGSHALLMAGGNLLTADNRIFASYFPELRIVSSADTSSGT